MSEVFTQEQELARTLVAGATAAFDNSDVNTHRIVTDGDVIVYDANDELVEIRKALAQMQESLSLPVHVEENYQGYPQPYVHQQEFVAHACPSLWVTRYRGGYILKWCSDIDFEQMMSRAHANGYENEPTSRIHCLAVGICVRLYEDGSSSVRPMSPTEAKILNRLPRMGRG